MRYIYPGQHCQRYDQVKVKLEGQATAMMGVMLLNLGKEMFSNIKKNLGKIPKQVLCLSTLVAFWGTTVLNPGKQRIVFPNSKTFNLSNAHTKRK